MDGAGSKHSQESLIVGMDIARRNKKVPSV
jgi:hypothetical protein